MHGQAGIIMDGRKQMELPNTPSSEEMRLHKNLTYIIVFAIIAVAPVLLSLLIQNNLSQKDYLIATSTLKCGFLNHNFWFESNSTDTSFYLIPTRDINLLLLLHNFVCLAGGAILLFTTISQKKKSLIPMMIPYLILAFISLNALVTDFALRSSSGLFLYNRISLLGFDIRVMHGALPVVIYSAIFAGYLVFLGSELIAKRKRA